ncbi:MAG: flavodoxin family protein [Armatimonadota bacterium]
MAKLLILYHSMSGNTRRMAEAVAAGAQEVPDTEVEVKKGLDARLKDLLDCDGVAFGSPDYFGRMAGGMQNFFDRTYYPAKGRVTGKPCVIFGSAGGSASTVIRDLRKMVRRFELDEIGEAVGASGNPDEEVLNECRALGRKLAEAAKSP